MAFVPWIKIEQTLPDKPEVIRMAGRLRIDQDAVTGKLLRVWIWADSNVIAGDGIPITSAFLGRLTNRKGFAAAMRAVGGLTGEEGALTFPGFERHNGETAKERATTARRVEKHRRSNGAGVTEVTEPPLSEPLPRIRVREEDTPLPPRGGQSERADFLIGRTKSLRLRWQASPVLSAKEQRVFRKNIHVLEHFTPEDWDVQRAFLAASLPEGSPLFQPGMLLKYLEDPGGTLGHARSWKANQRPKLAVVPPPVNDEPPLTAEERHELLSLKTK